MSLCYMQFSCVNVWRSSHELQCFMLVDSCCLSLQCTLSESEKKGDSHFTMQVIGCTSFGDGEHLCGEHLLENIFVHFTALLFHCFPMTICHTDRFATFRA